MSFVSHSERETFEFGAKFAQQLKPEDVVACFGELGSGKTCFIKGICAGLGVIEHVASPSFTIVKEYCVGGLKIYHFDFYRVSSKEEIFELGFEDYLNSNGISLIEWADRLQEYLPPDRYDVHLCYGDKSMTRIINIVKKEKI